VPCIKSSEPNPNSMHSTQRFASTKSSFKRRNQQNKNKPNVNVKGGKV